MNYRSIPTSKKEFPKVISAEDKDKVIKCLIDRQENGKMVSVIEYTDVDGFQCSKEQFNAIIEKLIEDDFIRRPNSHGYGNKYVITVNLMEFYNYGGYEMQEMVVMNRIDTMIENLNALMNFTKGGNPDVMGKIKECMEIATNVIKVLPIIKGCLL